MQCAKANVHTLLQASVSSWLFSIPRSIEKMEYRRFLSKFLPKLVLVLKRSRTRTKVCGRPEISFCQIICKTSLAIPLDQAQAEEAFPRPWQLPTTSSAIHQEATGVSPTTTNLINKTGSSDQRLSNIFLTSKPSKLVSFPI